MEFKVLKYKIKSLRITSSGFLVALFLLSNSFYCKSSFSQYIHDKGNEFSAISPLMTAVNNNDIEGVKFFSKAGANTINKKNIGGATALHLAARKKNGVDYINILIKNGANVNLIDNSGWTPLMRAAINGNLQNMMTLLKNNANSNAKNFMGDTIVKHAVISDCTPCVILILKYIDYTGFGEEFLQSQINQSLIIANKRSNFQIAEILKQYQQRINDIVRNQYLMNVKNETMTKIKRQIEDVQNNRKDYDEIGLITLEDAVHKIKNYILIEGVKGVVLNDSGNLEEGSDGDRDGKVKVVDKGKDGGIFAFFNRKRKSSDDLKYKNLEDALVVVKSDNDKMDINIEAKAEEGDANNSKKKVIYKLKEIKDDSKYDNFDILQNNNLDNKKEGSSFIDRAMSFFKNLFGNSD